MVLPGEGADAVLWEGLTEATHEESTLPVTYLAFITLATMIAACGVVLDNAILIVGAMAVGPEFGPLAGICTALEGKRPNTAFVYAPDLAYGETKQTIGSSDQLLLNLLGIVLAGTLTLLAQKGLWARQRERTAGPNGR